jgi:hypothetical protein
MKAFNRASSINVKAFSRKRIAFLEDTRYFPMWEIESDILRYTLQFELVD